LREPRRIEILGQEKIAHFQSDVAYYKVALIALFLQEERANPPKTFATGSNIETVQGVHLLYLEIRWGIL
jgi:hypothetical protein